MLELRSDIDPELDDLFGNWCNHHHTELLALHGVLRARRYVRMDGRSGVGRYLTIYDLESVAVLDTPAFLDHAKSGTPMPQALGPSLVYERTVATLIGEAGDNSGGHLMVRAMFDATPGEEGPALAVRLVDAGLGAASAIGVRAFRPEGDHATTVVALLACSSTTQNIEARGDDTLADGVAYRLVFEGTTPAGPGSSIRSG